MMKPTTPNPRAAMRGRLYLVGILPLLLAVLLAGKVGLMLGHNGDGKEAYADEDFSLAQSEFAGNRGTNYFESWIAAYNEGTARYRLDDFSGAIAAFKAALKTAPADQECRVRVNLALTHEKVGDAALETDPEAAKKGWQAGLDALADCPDPDSEAERRQVAADVQERLEQKLEEQEQQQQQQKQNPKQKDPKQQKEPQDPKEKKLQKRNEQGSKERGQRKDYDDYPDYDDGYQW